MILSGRVDRVIDGDTIWLRVRWRTTSSAPGARAKGGAEATDALKKRFPRGREVRVRVLTADVYGRIVGSQEP
jgi:endonuclease YncB( thermonuclease family)